jgi:hypothetical protein
LLRLNLVNERRDQFKNLGIAAVFEVVSGHGSTRIAMGITGRDAGSF